MKSKTLTLSEENLPHHNGHIFFWISNASFIDNEEILLCSQ